jgi:hypothetical protein
VVLSPAAFLGSRFGAYRDACGKAGLRYDAGLRGNVTSVDDLPSAIESLTAAGFPVAVDQRVRDAAVARAATLATVQAGADSSCADLDKRLAASGRALYPFQRAGVAFLRAAPGRLLADDMGLGKTIQALCAAPSCAPILVICPAVAKGVWTREAGKFRPDLKVQALSGRGSFRWPQAGELLSINYDILPPGDLPAAPQGCVVILDEAQAVKSARAARAVSAKRICAAAVSAGGASWALTGTPYENDGGEVYGILDVIGVAGDLWRSDRGSARTLCNWLAENRPAEFAAKLGRVMLRREKLDVLTDLPPKTRRIERVVLGPTETAALDALLVELGGLSAFAALVKALDEQSADLAEIAGDLAEAGDIGKLSKARAQCALAKVPGLVARVVEFERAGEPVIVMCDHRAPVDALATREGWARISGDESAEERTEVEDRFQRGELKGVACTIRAAGVALTLTRACKAIFVDRAWNPSKNDQAEDRAWRIGQMRPVEIIRLVAVHPIDDMIEACCERKEAGRAATVEAAAVTGTAAPVAEAKAALEALAAAPVVDAPKTETRRANRFAGACGKCGRQVAAEAGWLTGRSGSWGCEHKDGDAGCWKPLGVKDRSGTVRKLCETVAATYGEGANVTRNPRTTPVRPANSPVEEWAAKGLALLVSMDSDRAKEKNEVGFSAGDTVAGWQLAALIAGKGLTDEGWRLAIRVCSTYRHTQVGEPPSMGEVVESGANLTLGGAA